MLPLSLAGFKSMPVKQFDKILISRTDSLGDVTLTLPIAAKIKEHFPKSTIVFIGKSYTQPIIVACKDIDEFIHIDDFLKKEEKSREYSNAAIIHVLPSPSVAFKAKKLKISLRIGTTNRWYHWFTCNKLIRLSRRKSSLHEAQLNFKLLDGLNITGAMPKPDEIAALHGITRLELLPSKFSALIDKNKYNLILHPKSQGSGREWPVDHYKELIRLLDDSRFTIFISGTEKEKEAIKPITEQFGNKVINIVGAMSLPEFIAFINACDGLIASSTGPLHIAAALGRDALGIFPPIRPLHPERWAPIGANAHIFVVNKNCSDCKKDAAACHCMQEILPRQLESALNELALKRSVK